MKMIISIRVNGQPTTNIEVSGYDFAWEKYRELAETLEGLAVVELVDVDNGEVIESSDEE